MAKSGRNWAGIAIDAGAKCAYNARIMATQRIHFRLTPDERDGVESAARAMGMNQSEFLKAAALHCRDCAAFADEFKRPRISGRRGIRRLWRRPEGDDDVAE